MASARVSLAGRSILAADDHEVDRRILQLLLEPHGCRLTLVENGAEALEANPRAASPAKRLSVNFISFWSLG